jgi:hypothetical protein
MLFQITMDILPAQGSAVSCERVFSSAKQTTTDEHNRLLPETIEMRQILKYSLVSQRLSLPARWGVTLAEISMFTITNELEAALKARDLESVEKLVSDVDFA